MDVIFVTEQDDMRDFCDMMGGALVTSNAMSMKQADAHFLTRDDTGEPVARCSVWHSSTPSYMDRKVGFIGHYIAGGDEAAYAVLERACGTLKDAGCAYAIGPVDGNTLRNYRFVTERAIDGYEYPTFFMEPHNPDEWPLQWIECGFCKLSDYYSAFGSLDEVSDDTTELSARLRNDGIVVRAINTDNLHRGLEQIYDITVASFRDTLLFAPIERDEFISLYSPIQPYIRPDLMLIAEADGESVGFIFTVPDLAQKLRGENIDTLVMKTIAVLPEYAGRRIGTLLTAEVHKRAKALGMHRFIHALMPETNVTSKISAHYAKPMRRYTLFVKKL